MAIKYMFKTDDEADEAIIIEQDSVLRAVEDYLRQLYPDDLLDLWDVSICSTIPEEDIEWDLDAENHGCGHSTSGHITVVKEEV